MVKIVISFKVRKRDLLAVSLSDVSITMVNGDREVFLHLWSFLSKQTVKLGSFMVKLATNNCSVIWFGLFLFSVKGAILPLLIITLTSDLRHMHLLPSAISENSLVSSLMTIW